MEKTDLVERAEILIGRAVKQNPPGKGEGHVLTWKQAEAAVLDALAGVPALQARVEKLEEVLRSVIALHDSFMTASRGSIGNQADAYYHIAKEFEVWDKARAALAEDYCGIVEVNEEDFKAEGERG